jgi:hypothetical protein
MVEEWSEQNEALLKSKEVESAIVHILSGFRILVMRHMRILMVKVQTAGAGIAQSV